MKYFDLRDFYALFRWIWEKPVVPFEREFARYIEAKHALGTSFGRTALYAGLKAVGVNDREVILPAFTCTVVRQAVMLAGAIPRFVDIDPESFEFRLDDLKNKINASTKAIILTHYFGRVARNMQKVIQIAKDNHILVIEDCAHALGTEYGGKKTGTFGDFSIFSLTKGLINLGGGVLVTNNDNIYEKARGILQNERKTLKRRIIDFPIVLSYGLEQSICKLLFDRVKNHKWWLLSLPPALLKLRRHLLTLLKLPGKMVRSADNQDKKQNIANKRERKETYDGGIHMEPIIASIGRSQLGKTESLINQRKIAYQKLVQGCKNHLNTREDPDARDVYTHFVLRFSNNDIFEIIKKCRGKGLSLVATWPTRQKKWRHLDSDHMKRVEKEILLWNINPDLSDREIEQAVVILNSVNNPEMCETSHSAQSDSHLRNEDRNKMAGSLHLNP